MGIFFVPQNENNVPALVKFSLFRTCLTIQHVLVYAFKIIDHHALDFEIANWSARKEANSALLIYSSY